MNFLTLVMGSVFLCWALTYAEVHSRSDYRVCGPLPVSSAQGMPWTVHPFNHMEWEQWLGLVTKNPLGDLTPTEESSMFDHSDSKQYVFPLVQN